ncbi:hypothetical protein FRC11_014686, partial [Ceratobasidium sp. 423]
MKNDITLGGEVHRGGRQDAPKMEVFGYILTNPVISPDVSQIQPFGASGHCIWAPT